MNPNRIIFYLTLLLLLIIYFWNLGYNDIWNPNEGFYADATLQMFEKNNYWEFFYNDELRFNKPPVTYWSIAMFVPIFGINEFSIRFPMALMSLLTIWICYLMGRKLYDKKIGLLTAMVMALSLQFTVNARYSSPEIPLTFFFTLTMYWFLKAYKDRSTSFLFLGYIAFGFTMLCKGFPYLIIIGAIVVVYLFLDKKYDWKAFFKEVIWLKLWFGLPLVLFIGISWPLSMYLMHEEAFLAVLNEETVDRALFKEMYNLIRGIFYYPEAISWGFLPYSLVFFTAFVFYVRKKETLQRHGFEFSWILVMLVIFTASSGKLPTYFLQAHPAMALMAASFIAYRLPSKKPERLLWYITLWLPGTVITALGIFLTYLLDLNSFYYFICGIPLMIWMISLNRHLDSLTAQLLEVDISTFTYLKFFPFFAMIATMLVFAGGVLVKLETFRPYDQIGATVQQLDIPEDTPVHLDQMDYLNLPYYTKRKKIAWSSPEAIQADARKNQHTLALIRTENLDKVENEKVLWDGWIYDNTSEAKFSKFVLGYLEARNGNFEKYANFSLILIE